MHLIHVFLWWSAYILDTLGLYSIPGVAYDSSQHEHAPSCLQNSHMDVMRRIWDWVDGNSSHPMYLLTGVACSGKSTIAQTFFISFTIKVWAQTVSLIYNHLMDPPKEPIEIV